MNKRFVKVHELHNFVRGNGERGTSAEITYINVDKIAKVTAMGETYITLENGDVTRVKETLKEVIESLECDME